MKKSLLALAVAGAFSGAAFAQSSVTVFGVADASLARVKGEGDGAATNGGQDGQATKLLSGSNQTSRIGVRGTEDLGGGLQAGFWLEAGVSLDSGVGQNSNTTNQTTGANASSALQFNRRATVSLLGGFGEVRLGRDYTPTFLVQVANDPFGAVGVGTDQPLLQGTPGLLSSTLVNGVRASNQVEYFLPADLGGFYGNAIWAQGENTSGPATASDGNTTGLRVGFKTGPFDIAGAMTKTKYATATNNGDNTINTIGGSWNFGVAKVSLVYNTNKVATTVGDVKTATWKVGGWIPVGAGTIKLGYSKLKDKSPNSTTGVLADAAGTARALDGATQISVGYVHDVSKRTALYGTYSQISNKGNAQYTISSGVTPDYNKSSSGLEVGIRHSF